MIARLRHVSLGFACSLLLLGSCTTPIPEEKIVVVHDTVTKTLAIHDTIFLNKKVRANENSYYWLERLPNWVIKEGFWNEDLEIAKHYALDARWNPIYLEADFNGGGSMDVALPIQHNENGKLGIAIIHGEDNEVFILGAGELPVNGLVDHFDYYDIWKINRLKMNEAGLLEETGTGPKGELHIENPSINILVSNLGGGLLYWNGEAYAYFHQTC